MTGVDRGSTGAESATGPAHRGSVGGFGLLLRRFRAGAQLTQEELAERSGVSVRAIADAESGRTQRPQLRSVQMLADALGLAGPERAALVAFSRGQRSDPGEIIRPGASAEPDRPAGGLLAVPHQLPAAVAPFVGRKSELAALSDLLGQMRGAASTVVISVIAGTAGVGKTALAVQWAHQLADRFPDGQLYVNLRGYDPGQPMSAADALARFLRDLGVAGPDIPADEQERAARYRSLLAGRRMLIVLDNVAEPGQVRPLLPGSHGCATVVTSRDALAGLVARDGARRLDLDLLPSADAISLLETLIGARVADEPDAAAALAVCCCQLPLTLRIAAELAVARPGASVTSLAAELSGQQPRLDLLAAGGDSSTAVRAVFSWSIRHLDPGTVRAFWLLGLHPGPDLDACAATALTGASPQHTRLLLDQLVRAHLIHEPRHR